MIYALLIFGCAAPVASVWELGMTLEEFKGKNDRLELHYASIDSTVYTRGEMGVGIGTPYHWYTFVDGKLSSVEKGKYVSKPKPQEIEIKIDDK